MEMTAVMKTVRWSASASMVALALALNCGVASAQQQKAPESAKTAPAKKATPEAKKAAPACNSLKVEAACSVAPGCQWIAASKTKAGKEVKAYCRTASKAKAKPAAKAAEPKAAMPKTEAPKAPAKKN